MKPALTKQSEITVDMIRENRALCPHITGEIHAALRGAVTNLRGNVSGLRGAVSGLHGEVNGLYGDVTGLYGEVSGLCGEVTGLRGDVTNLRGNVTGLCGDLDRCDISDADRMAGVDVQTLVLPA